MLEEYKAVAKALRREGFRARAVNVKEDLGRLERLLRRNPPDVIFNLVEYIHDDPELEPHVASLFELHHVAYTGAPPFALTLCQRKGLAKQLLQANGVPTPRFTVLHAPKPPSLRGFHYPLIVKPAREDASTGIDQESVVSDAAELKQRLEYLFHEFAPPFLLEEFIDGPELHVAVLGNDPPRVLPPIEWDFSELPEGYPPIISFAAKWNPLHEVYHRVHTLCPPELPRRVLEKVEDVALRAYALTGCRDYARLDIRLDRKNRPFVLEVNPNPDLTEGVSLMESAEVAGYSFSQTLKMIVQFALERRAHLDRHRSALDDAHQARTPISPEGLRASLKDHDT